MSNERARVHLRQISVANRCTVDWNTMRGEGAVRFCGSCRQNVYNLSEMSEEAVEQLLDRGDAPCVRYYHRPDGTIVTSTCPTKTRVPSIAVASALAYTTAFVGISAAVETDRVASQSEPLQVAMGGLRLQPKPVTPEERARRQQRREERARRQRAQDAIASDASISLAPSAPAALHSMSTPLHVEATQASPPRWPALVALGAMLALALALSFVLVRGVH